MFRLAHNLVASLAVASFASAQSIVRLSVGPGGAEADDHSGDVSISADGRWVAFDSRASNLVALDTNGVADIFVHDRVVGTNRRVSVTSSGAEGFGQSATPFLSANGRYVAFTSLAQLDVWVVSDWKPFVHDLELGATTQITLYTAAARGISDDGRYVLLATDSAVVATDTNSAEDVYLYDRVANTSELISVALDGTAGRGTRSAMSSDARFVVFMSGASNLVAADTNGASDVFLRDRTTSTTTRMSVDSSGAEIAFGSEPSISADGRFVAFVTSSNLTGAPATFYGKAYVRDRVSGTVGLASISNQGAPPDWAARWPQLSASGRFVAYTSFASNLGGAQANGHDDVFVYDRQLALTRLASHDSNGDEPNGESPATSFTAGVAVVASSGVVAFTSEASNLLAQADGNGKNDLFLALDASVPTTYCTAGTSAANCVGSLSAAGTPRLGVASGFVVTASAIDGQRSGIFFYGISGPIAAPWGASWAFVCVKNPKQRAPAQTSGGSAGACNGSLAVDWNTLQFNSPGAFGGTLAVGRLVQMQAWWRDPPSPKTSMLSNALQFDVLP